MAGETVITVVGNLTADPELRFTPSGAAVANFTVASTPRTFDRQSGEWKDGEALFLRCNVWRQPAENVAESLTRGMRVMVSGRLRQRSFETREGEKRTVVELEVDEVGPSLRYATAKVNKVCRGEGGGGGFGGGGGGGGWLRVGGGGYDDPWGSAPPAGSAPAPTTSRPSERLLPHRDPPGEPPCPSPSCARSRRRSARSARTRHQDIDYKDTGLLRKFISDRGKIRARRVSGNCRQHQRDVAVAVKNSPRGRPAALHLDRALSGWRHHEAHPHRDVPNLGAPGDIVEVKDGYGRNYLLPRGLAIVATRGAEKQVDAIRRARKSREIRDLGHAREVAAQLGGLAVTVQAKAAGDSGRLFGSVTAADVVDAVRAAGGPALDRRAVERAQPDQDRRHAPRHGAPAPGGHHRAGRGGRRRLTPVVTVP